MQLFQRCRRCDQSGEQSIRMKNHPKIWTSIVVISNLNFKCCLANRAKTRERRTNASILSAKHRIELGS
jgi:hypothetical protein